MKTKTVSWYIGAGNRTNTPFVNDGDRLLHYRHIAQEGQYDVYCDIEQARVWVLFRLYHNDNFLDPITIADEYRADGPAATKAFTHLKQGWILNNLMDVGEYYCTPVKMRDQKIDNLADQISKRVFRQRNHKKFFVDVLFERATCKAWHVQHYHGARVRITDAETHQIVQEEKFDCNHVFSSIDRFKYIINNFDVAYMELHL